MKKWICPFCGKETTEYPALSRSDNKTKICSECGMKEAMIDYFTNIQLDYEDDADKSDMDWLYVPEQ